MKVFHERILRNVSWPESEYLWHWLSTLLISILNLSARIKTLPVFPIQHEGKISCGRHISHTRHSLVQTGRSRSVSNARSWDGLIRQLFLSAALFVPRF